jgi:hypothetical protein
MPYVVKAALADPAAEKFSFDETTMWDGKKIKTGDEIYIFAAGHKDGSGLRAKGEVTEVRPGEGIRVFVEVKRTAIARARLGRQELKPHRDKQDGSPQAEIGWRLYKQATNKIAGISELTAAFLDGFF